LNQELLQIAQLCINQDGNAVVRAQSLLPDSLNFYREELVNCDTAESIISGLNENSKLSDLQAYPNPSAGNIFLQWPDTKEVFQVELYNSIGKIISKYDLKEHTDKFSLSLGDHNEPNACYFISVRYQDGSTEVKKILFQKQ